MAVNVVRCLVCGDIIFSRTNHDFRPCSCGSVQVDAGPGVGRVNGDKENWLFIEYEIKETSKELYYDWNKRIDKLGLIKDGITEDELIKLRAKNILTLGGRY